MGFLEELKAIKENVRRLEQSWFDREAEVIKLRDANAKANEEINRLRERHEPGSRKIAEDCLRCAYRTQVLKQTLDKGGTERGKIEVKGGSQP